MLIHEKLNLKEGMSETEAGIAGYFLEQGTEIQRYSTRGLAEATYTSLATVIRLCKKLGFKGFDDFKEQYISEIQYLEQQSGTVDANFPFSKDDTFMKTANSITQLYVDTAQDTLSLLKHGMLQRATKLLRYSRKIYIFSAGTAINQAESFREKMLKIGKHVSISNNLNYQLYEAECLSSQDVAIIISYSGETEKTLQVARECKAHSVPIIAITSFGENSLSQFAACKLTMSTKENIYRNLGDFSSHLSMCLLLDILYSSYFLLDYEAHYQKKLEKAMRLENLRKSTNSILMDSEKK